MILFHKHSILKFNNVVYRVQRYKFTLKPANILENK